MKHIALPVALAAAITSFSPSFAYSQVAEARLPHSSGGTILQRAGRYVAGTYESPAVRRAARIGLTWGARGLATAVLTKAAPVLAVAAGAYGTYETGRVVYEWVFAE